MPTNPEKTCSACGGLGSEGVAGREAIASYGLACGDEPAISLQQNFCSSPLGNVAAGFLFEAEKFLFQKAQSLNLLEVGLFRKELVVSP